MPEVSPPSLTGFAVRLSDESGSYVEQGLAVNIFDNYPADLKSNLINTILDDFIYPHIIRQTKEKKIPFDFQLQMAQLVMYDDESKNNTLLNHEVNFFGNVNLTNKEFEEGGKIVYSDIQDVIGLYPSIESDLNSANIMLLRFEGKWEIAGDFVYNKGRCKKIIAEAQKRLRESRSNLESKRVKEFLEKLYETVMYFLISYLLARRVIVFTEVFDASDIFKNYRNMERKSLLGARLVSLSDEITQLKAEGSKKMIDSTEESRLENLLDQVDDIISAELKLYNHFDISQKPRGHFIKFGGFQGKGNDLVEHTLDWSEDNSNHNKNNNSPTRELSIPSISKDKLEADRWDAFICHASEDKDDFVRPLANKLRSMGLTIWYDEFTLRIGDRLSQKIDQGLASSDYGIVILSKYFFKKTWTKSELSALNTRSIETDKAVILPVWYQITKEEIATHSAILVDTFAVSSEKGIEFVAEKLFNHIKENLDSSFQLIESDQSVIESEISDISYISDEELKAILLEFDKNTPKLKLESSVKRFEKCSRSKSFLNHENVWEIICKLILSNNYDFNLHGLIAIRNLIDNNNGKLKLISRNLSQIFDRIEDLEVQHPNDRIKDDVFYIIHSLYDIEEFSKYCRDKILFTINHVEDGKYDVFVSKYLQFFISNGEYFHLLKEDLEKLMNNNDRSGRRAQTIYNELI